MTRIDLTYLQNEEELEYYLSLLVYNKTKKLLEIGSYLGGTIAAATFRCNLDLAVSIDTSPGPKGTIDLLKEEGFNTHFLNGDSKDPEIISKAKELGPYDVVFIDGDHSYEGVRLDYENYKDMADVVVFHDVYATNNEVSKFWSDLRWSDERFQEIREFRIPKTDMGYGVLFK